MRSKKPTHTEELLIDLYKRMKKEDPEVTVSEVQAEFNRIYGTNN